MFNLVKGLLVLEVEPKAFFLLQMSRVFQRQQLTDCDKLCCGLCPPGPFRREGGRERQRERERLIVFDFRKGLLSRTNWSLEGWPHPDLSMHRLAPFSSKLFHKTFCLAEWLGHQR